MPRAFSARLVRTISTSAIAGLAMVGVLAATASADETDVNSVRRETSVDSSGGYDLQVTRFIFNSTSDDAGAVDSEAPATETPDATAPDSGDSGTAIDRHQLVNSV